MKMSTAHPASPAIAMRAPAPPITNANDNDTSAAATAHPETNATNVVDAHPAPVLAALPAATTHDITRRKLAPAQTPINANTSLSMAHPHLPRKRDGLHSATKLQGKQVHRLPNTCETVWQQYCTKEASTPSLTSSTPARSALKPDHIDTKIDPHNGSYDFPLQANTRS